MKSMMHLVRRRLTGGALALSLLLALSIALPFATAGKSTFGVAVEPGTAVLWNTTARPLFLIDLAPALRYDYRAKEFS